MTVEEAVQAVQAAEQRVQAAKEDMKNAEHAARVARETYLAACSASDGAWHSLEVALGRRKAAKK